MDAISLLKEDHARVKALFKEAEELGEGANVTRRKIFNQIAQEMDMHAMIEEKFFYPAFQAKTKAKTEERTEILEAYEEHDAVKDLIAKIRGMQPADETLTAKMKFLSELIDHHVQEEEKEMFKEVRHLLSKEDLVEIGRQMDQAKHAQLVAE